MISRSADYKEVNVRCREDHKAQNMVEFDEEVSAAAIVFTSQIGFVHKQTKQSHIFEIISRKTKHNALFRTWWFDTEFSFAIFTMGFCHGSG